MTDDELIAGFEAGTIPPGTFGHREHVRLAWLYVRRHGRAGAERRLLTGLRAFAAAAGKPDKFDAALTLAWVSRIDAAAAALAADHSFDDLLVHHPELLDRRSAGEVAQTI
jgi:N-formylglutamate deformylase